MLPSQNALVQSRALEASVGPLSVVEQDTAIAAWNSLDQD